LPCNVLLTFCAAFIFSLPMRRRGPATSSLRPPYHHHCYLPARPVVSVGIRFVAGSRAFERLGIRSSVFRRCGRRRWRARVGLTALYYFYLPTYWRTRLPNAFTGTTSNSGRPTPRVLPVTVVKHCGLAFLVPLNSSHGRAARLDGIYQDHLCCTASGAAPRLVVTTCVAGRPAGFCWPGVRKDAHTLAAGRLLRFHCSCISPAISVPTGFVVCFYVRFL